MAAVIVDNSSGTCTPGCSGDDALPAVFPSIVGGYNMPGIKFGMDQKDSNSCDEVQSKRYNVTAVDDEWLSEEEQG